MRRQASRSLWPYLGLLLCLLVMSLAAPHSWYVGERAEPQHGAAGEKVGPHEGPLLLLAPPAADPPRQDVGDIDVPGATLESGRRTEEVSARGMFSMQAAMSPRLVAERLVSLIDLMDEVALPRLPRFVPLPPAVPLPLTGGKPPARQWTAEPTTEGRVAVARARGARATPRPAEPQERSVLVQRRPGDHSSTSDSSADASNETFSSPAALDQDTPEVRPGDSRDRLALRLRPFKRLGNLANRSAEGAVPEDPAAEKLSWLTVEPSSLLERLGTLAGSTSPQAAGWAESVRGKVQQLCREASADRSAAAGHLAELSRFVDAGRSMEQQLSPEERNELQLTRAAVIRRLAAWGSLINVTRGPAEWEAFGERFAKAASEADAALEATPQGRDWAAYLLLKDIEEMWEARPERSDKRLRQLIEQLADRLASPHLTASQRELLAEEPLATLRRRLGDWAAATVDLEVLCKAIEAQEAGGGEVYARRIAADARLLSLASDSAPVRAAATINRYYRNPNLRLAVSRAFLQRLIPKQPATLEPVRDTIAGVAVAGQSLTEADVRAVLVPDPDRWRIGLEVKGNVAAQTASTSGPATLHSAARTEYVARKLVVLSTAGLHSFPAVAGAAADNMLQGLETSFDGIPLVEGLVRSIVINQHEMSRGQALAEVESRVSRKARQRLDSQLDERLQQAAGRVRENVWSPLVELGLAPDAVELETTSERLVGECRLAADRQLAAHTPRPYALADSLLSMQVHQSVLNNLVERLELSDRECSLPELYREVAAKLGRESVTIPEDLSPTARIHFARFDPLAVAIEDGRVRITLSLYAVKDGRHRFHDFKVHAYYRPQVNGLHAQLVREGIIEIEGRNLRPGDYIVLQGVFVSLFSESRPLTVVPADRNDDPRLAGLMITQLVLEEGWLGVAIGPGHPRRTALMTRIVR